MNKYLYAPVWTKAKSHVEAIGLLPFMACYLLDFDERVVSFERNIDKSHCNLAGEKGQLTPQLKVYLDTGESFYLYCFKQGTLDRDLVSKLKNDHDIVCWSEETIKKEPELTNIKLIRRYHSSAISEKQRRTEIEAEITSTLNSLIEITPLIVSELKGMTVGQAKAFLLAATAHKKLSFDMAQPLTERTAFVITEKS